MAYAVLTDLDPEVLVQLPGTGKANTTWNISAYLSTSCGALNVSQSRLPAYAELEEDFALLERLRAQRWEEVTFIARKDGVYGLLYELEFVSRESADADFHEDVDYIASLKPQKQVEKELSAGLAVLSGRFAGVQFCIPDSSSAFLSRPTVWAFVPDGVLDADGRNALGNALLAL